jgi:hypothetical protein
MSGSKSKNLSRREILELAGVAVASPGLSACAPSLPLTSTPASTALATESNKPDASDLIHLVCYPEIEDFDLLARRGINTVLMELGAHGDDWQAT